MLRDILQATRLTRTGHLAAATALLQRALQSETAPIDGSNPGAPKTSARAARAARTIDLVAETIAVTDPAAPSLRAVLGGVIDPNPAERNVAPDERAAPRRFQEHSSAPDIHLGMAWARARRPLPQDAPEDEGQFVTRSFGTGALRCVYKLYIPLCYRGQALPLIVMLHGCTQSPDDFAAGTRMNTVAEENGCFVAYPAQDASANASKCWNWFSPTDQQRDGGEPALIVGITRQIMRDYSVDPRRVYVAGLSAGAAAAAIMGMTYPDVYAAIGVHSGLACGAARDLPSAFAAMRNGDEGSHNALSGGGRQLPVPTIVFHGDQDRTVSPRNGDHVLAQASGVSFGDMVRQVEHGRVPGGHSYTRTSFAKDGEVALEQWVIHGAGHAWSGGSPAGSYTDPKGPDAAREMLRFFLEHPHQVIASVN